MMICPKCNSDKISEVPNNTLDVVAKCDKCGYEDFVGTFEKYEKVENCPKRNKFSECRYANCDIYTCISCEEKQV